MIPHENPSQLSHWPLLHTTDPEKACSYLSSLFRPNRLITHSKNKDNYLIKITLRGRIQVRQLNSCFDVRANTICALNASRSLEDRTSFDCDFLIVQIAGEDVQATLEYEFGIDV